MASVYISPDEYAAYGLPASTPVAAVQGASALIDAFLKRPEGMVWTPDANGAPCYMAARTPSFSLILSSGISAGANVVASVSGMVTPDLVGEVLILDRAVSGRVEAVVVTTVNTTPGQTSITLASVQFPHSSGAIADAGMVIFEERNLPANRAVGRISRPQFVRMIATQGRYAYGRRSQQIAGAFANPSLLTSVQAFGGPPPWYPVDVSHVSVSPTTGEVWVPPGAINAVFSDVRLRYVAGYSAANLPGAIKAATSTAVQSAQNFPELVGNLKSLQAGGSKIERFADTLLDAGTQATLQSFAARVWY